MCFPIFNPILKNIKGLSSHYTNHHGVDLLLEIRGRLPENKDRLQGIMDRFLGLNKTDQINFSRGRQLDD
tara:strand:+ start:115 stop:324 length:210 start_codon:yes stop_codon:yes gene_type:complete